MPPSSADNSSKSSSKKHKDSGKPHDTAAKTTSNTGYVSHRQAWAERKKKKSGDKAKGASIAGTADAIEDSVELVIEAIARSAEEL